ncbi:hypothetical protein GCM10023206_10860 [Acinetobacter puyangensis]|uniref:Uncharacterized protein n=1 Tax=Acinetobacter puyangensis TaxID=1096779 RepID=A0A240EA71_9GAMM|nr:hypothetical protein SAMN05421731_105158 [Acinetobacter puyangensis]
MHKHRFKAPLQNYFFRILITILSCHRLLRLRRYIMRYLPFLKLKSEVHDVVYLSWLVDVDQLKNHFPKHVPLWEKKGKQFLPFSAISINILVLLSFIG